MNVPGLFLLKHHGSTLGVSVPVSTDWSSLSECPFTAGQPNHHGPAERHWAPFVCALACLMMSCYITPVSLLFLGFNIASAVSLTKTQHSDFSHFTRLELFCASNITAVAYSELFMGLCGMPCACINSLIHYSLCLGRLNHDMYAILIRPQHPSHSSDVEAGTDLRANKFIKLYSCKDDVVLVLYYVTPHVPVFLFLQFTVLIQCFSLIISLHVVQLPCAGTSTSDTGSYCCL